VVDGRWTRGTTARGRLAALDAVIVHLRGPRLCRADGSAFVDVGFGAAPWTTLEAARVLRELDPALRVVAIELDAERVQAATAALRAEEVEVVWGGFDAVAGVEARLVRAMNVLRAYPVHEVPAALAALGAGLVEGGMLVEGTCGRRGEVLAASLIGSAGGRLEREALVLHTDFSGGFAPRMFWPRLPRDLRRHPEVDAFVDRWTAAWQTVRVGLEAPAAFAASVRALQARGEAVRVDPWLLQRGTLVWTAPPALGEG
jgi:hypothetical protein